MGTSSERFSFKTFKENFEKYRSQAFKNICEIESCGDVGDNWGVHLNEEALAWNLKMMHLRLLFAFETFGYVEFIKTFKDGFERFSAELGTLVWHDDADQYHSPAFSYLVDFYNVFSLLAQSAEEESGRTDREKLQLMLQGAPRMVMEEGADPKNEAEVRRIVGFVLGHCYPDLQKEIPVKGIFKDYKPDFGIPSLETAIEFKFVDSELQLKNCLGGIYEDEKGYKGTKDWKHFIGVIYMTDAYAAPAQVKAEEKRVKMPKNWTLLLVNGKGKRLEKKAKPANAKASQKK